MKTRNLIAKVMFKRFQNTTKKMRDRRLRRLKDFKNSWKKDWE